MHRFVYVALPLRMLDMPLAFAEHKLIGKNFVFVFDWLHDKQLLCLQHLYILFQARQQPTIANYRLEKETEKLLKMSYGNNNFVYPQGVNRQPVQQVSLPQQGGGQFGAPQGMQCGGQPGMPNYGNFGNLSNISALPQGNAFPNMGSMPNLGAQLGAGGMGAHLGGLTQMGGLGGMGMGGMGLGQLGGLSQMGGMGQFPMLNSSQMPPFSNAQMGPMNGMNAMNGMSAMGGGMNGMNAMSAAMNGMSGMNGAGSDGADYAHLNNYQHIAGHNPTGAGVQKMNTSNGLLNMFRKA